MCRGCFFFWGLNWLSDWKVLVPYMFTFSYFPKITHLKFNSSLKSYGIPKGSRPTSETNLPSWLFLGQACYSTWEVYSLGIFRIFFKRMSSRWLNHSFEKYWSNWIISSRIGVKIEKCLKPPPRRRLRVANSAPKQRQDLQNHNIRHWLKRCKRKP